MPSCSIPQPRGWPVALRGGRASRKDIGTQLLQLVEARAACANTDGSAVVLISRVGEPDESGKQILEEGGYAAALHFW